MQTQPTLEAFFLREYDGGIEAQCLDRACVDAAATCRASESQAFFRLNVNVIQRGFHRLADIHPLPIAGPGFQEFRLSIARFL